MPCYSRSLAERGNLRPTNPKHFYLELEANICSHSSLRKPVTGSTCFFFLICGFFFPGTKAAVTSVYPLVPPAMPFRSAISQPEAGAPPVFIEFPSISQQSLFFLSCTQLLKKGNEADFYFPLFCCPILLQIRELPLPWCKNALSVFHPNKKSVA